LKEKQNSNQFRDVFYKVRPILMKEPLAETLGVFGSENVVLEYSFIDVVKAAGHACPTVTGAYLCCQEALDDLFAGETPARGEIGITIYGRHDEGALGVMSQVFTYITGAATETGFKGLGSRFKRKDLMKFAAEKLDEEAICFRFERLDTGKAVIVRFYPWLIPFPADKSQRLAALMQQVVTGGADEGERGEFRDLWVEKIMDMALERKEIGSWLQIENV